MGSYVRTGTAAFDGALRGPKPTLFRARTVNVYAVPMVRPANRHERVVVVHVAPPGLTITS
jgi:hypothetical protein